MHISEEQLHELNILIKFNLDSIQEGIKIHHTAEQHTIDAAKRLYDKGFISQVDGGYLTDLGRELAELSQNALTVLTSSRCL